MNILSIVEFLRNKNKKHVKLIMNEKDILKKVILCKYYLSSQKWSIQNYIKEIFNIKNPIDNISGDGYTESKLNIEIKISLNSDKFSFVQIRPDHNIDYYLFLVYNLYEDGLGKVYWFLIPSKELYDLIIIYGSYAHSTTKKLGKINKDNMFGKNYEYALRFNMKHKIWSIFTSKYNKNIEEIKEILI